jgi:signal transduction histidine kinase
MKLLVQCLGAIQGIVYLTEHWQQDMTANLIPVFCYPEPIGMSGISSSLPLRFAPSTLTSSSSNATQFLNGTSTDPDLSFNPSSRRLVTPQPTEVESTALSTEPFTQVENQQMVCPLVYEGMVIGFLVAARSDREWNSWEQQQVENIAHTLATACVLDQRYQWLLQRQQTGHDDRKDLLNDILHQLRSPLTALKTFGKLLLKRFSPTDSNRDIAASIIRESDHLRDLLHQMDQVLQDLPGEERSASVLSLPEAILQTPRSREGIYPDQRPFLLPATNPIHIQPCQVPDVLAPLIATAQAIAQDRRLQLRVDIPPHLPPIQADLKRLQEAVNNVIENALKYTPTGGQISIQVRAVANRHQIAIAVTDTGPGIPNSDQTQIFERHYRGVQSEGAIPGSGLGLAIVRDLIQQMQGEIEVHSPAHLEWQGTQSMQAPGTTFILWLPIAEA